MKKGKRRGKRSEREEEVKVGERRASRKVVGEGR